MRISDWSSDVCSSDLILFVDFPPGRPRIVDYEAKWAPESDAYANTPRRFDLAADDAALAAELSRLALAAWHLFGLAGYARSSEERRVGEACVSTCSSRSSPYH